MNCTSRYLLGLALISLTLPALAEGGKHHKRMFERLDANKDGMISLEEFQPPGKHQGPMEKADSNNDGAVTLEEMQAMRAAKMAEHDARMTERFTMMDTNGDGAVTQEEARQTMFNHMDANQDGQLSADELRRPKGGKGHKNRGDDMGPGRMGPDGDDD
jgi:Ca2+-binding EF-hand superfamily protein